MKLIHRWKESEPTLQLIFLRVLTPFAGVLDELICFFSFTFLVGSFKYSVLMKRTELMFKHKNKQQKELVE